MKKTVDEINKMIMEDAPMEEINDAIGYIDICSCFDPIFEPPIDFLEECKTNANESIPCFLGLLIS